jgi:hypothetical protein
MAAPTTDPHSAIRLVAGGRRLADATAAAAATAVDRPPAADNAATLRLFWYPLEADDDPVRGQLIAAAHRLDCAIDELRADARVPDLTRALESCEYHLENLAMRLFELRELLLDLIDLAGDGPAHRPERVARVLDLMEGVQPLRDVRGQRMFLHLNLRLGQRLYDPRAAARALRGRTDMHRAERLRVRLAVRDAIAAHADRAAAILALSLALLDPPTRP